MLIQEEICTSDRLKYTELVWIQIYHLLHARIYAYRSNRDVVDVYRERFNAQFPETYDVRNSLNIHNSLAILPLSLSSPLPPPHPSFNLYLSYSVLRPHNSGGLIQFPLWPMQHELFTRRCYNRLSSRPRRTTKFLNCGSRRVRVRSNFRSLGSIIYRSSTSLIINFS